MKRRERMTNPKCLGNPNPDNFDARSADFTGLFLMSITSAVSFDQLIGEREQIVRNFDAECLSGGEIYDQFVFGPKFDRQVAGLFALENPTDVDTGAAISIRLTWSVADQAANLSVLAVVIHRRQGVPGCEPHELPALTDEEYSSGDEQPARARLADLCERRMDFTLLVAVPH